MNPPVAGDPSFASGGEMGARIRTFDWGRTPVGPPAQWSNSLRSIVSVILSTRHPMFLWWGPELVQFYNDAYRPSLGANRHPVALGASGREFWAEIWPAIGPQIEAVMTRGEPTWNEDHLVPISRNGRLEEVYWTYGYSPVRDDDGRVGGTLVVVQERTAQVVAARRLRTLRDLAARSSSSPTQAAAWKHAVDALGANPHDVPWVLIYALSDDGAHAHLVGQNHVSAAAGGGPALEGGHILHTLVKIGQPLIVDASRTSVGEAVVPPWPEPVTMAWLAPIRRPDAGVPYGILASGISPRLPFDADYRMFLSMAADQVSTSLTNARRHEEEQQRFEALAELSARFRELFEQAPAGVAVFSGAEHRFEVANPIYRAITRRTSLVGLTFAAAFPELVGTRLAAALDHVYATGEPFRADEYHVALDFGDGNGLTDCFFTFHLAAVRDRGAQVAGLIVVAVEVTDQVRARHQLQHAQERLTFTLEAAGVGYWELDLATRVANRSLQHDRIFGYPSGAPQWTFDSFLAHVTSQDRARVTDAVQQAVATGHQLRFECRIVGADGVQRWIQVSARVERSSEGTAARLLGVVLDITERRELLDREQRAREEAEHANHAKDEFLATLSHELRTPLNTILGWSDLLSEGDLHPSEVLEGLSAIRRNAGVQAQLIEDLLYMSRIISGKVHLNPRPVVLADVIAQAVESLRRTAEAKGVRIFSGLTGAAGLVVAADPERLQQVFWNLLGNAVKFTPGGGRIDVSLDASGADLQVSVRDTGEGIDPEFLPHMFERFRQGDGKTTRSYGGLGIGLSIARQLVELHGGTISGSSEGRGAGATFTVTLPAAPRGADAPLTSRQASLRLPGVRILVVEDDRDGRELLHRIFAGLDASVVEADSAAQAMTALARQRFDLLVSDIGMPFEDGYELIRQVRALPASEGGGIPAIALTAYARPEDRHRVLNAGFQRHIAKPVVQSELLVACRSLIARLT